MEDFLNSTLTKVKQYLDYYTNTNLENPEPDTDTSPDRERRIGLKPFPHTAIINVLQYVNANVSPTLTTPLISQSSVNVTNHLVNTTIELLEEPYFTGISDENVSVRITNQMKPVIYAVHPNSNLIANSASQLFYPTKVDGGLFHSKLGSSIGYIVAKEYSTGIPYEGFQTEQSEWSNVLQYENRVANVTSDLGPF